MTPLTREQLRVEYLSGGVWRVTDRRLSGDDPAAVLGTITTISHGFEVRRPPTLAMRVDGTLEEAIHCFMRCRD